MNEQRSASPATAPRVLRAASIVALLLTAASFLAYALTRSPSAVGAMLVLLIVSVVLVSASRVVRGPGRTERQAGGAAS